MPAVSSSNRMGTENRIRYYHFMTGVLLNQGEDHRCRICKAFENSTRSIRESLDEFECTSAPDLKDIPPDLKKLLDETRLSLAGIKTPVDAQGQKKAGRCRMPERACFVKTSKAIIEHI